MNDSARSVSLIVPCKGLDNSFHANMKAFLNLDYPNYQVLFVVERSDDPAAQELRTISATAQILVAGPCVTCSQKNHNLLYAIQHLPKSTEILAFADSDIQVHRDWLTQLTQPLSDPGCGLATGYRWFVPTRNNLATLTLAATNAAIAQLLSNPKLSLCWGGSMAMRFDDFKRLDIAKIWKRTLSDDLATSRAVRASHMQVAFIPRCLVAAPVSSTWPHLIEFVIRQFRIIRLYHPAAWRFSLINSLASTLGFWGLIVLTLHQRAAAPALASLIAIWAIRAVARQRTAGHLLPEYAQHLRAPAWVDIAGCWLWPTPLLILIAISSFSNTITWRGIRYTIKRRTTAKSCP